MPYIVGRAAREHELYSRLKDFVTGVGFVGRAYFTGSGTGKLLDPRTLDITSGETLTLTCEAVAQYGGSFGVVSSARGTLPDAEVNQVYADSNVQFYLDFGATDFALNDAFVLKFVEYGAPAKPKLSGLTPKIGTLTETLTLTCTQAGIVQPGGGPDGGALFSVMGSLSGDLGVCTQGTEFSSTAASLTLARGDSTNAGEQFAVGETIVIHTTENPLKALGQQWTTMRALQDYAAGEQFGSALPASDSELILKGPGLAGDDEIFVGLRRFWSNSGGYAYWELAGMRGYSGGLTYGEQPKVLPETNRPNLTLWSGDLPYWISVTGRKITAKVRNNNYYMDLYLGLGIPWGSPKFQPYFLCVGGSSGDDNTSWTALVSTNSNYWSPRAGSAGDSSMQVLTRSGVWQGYLVRTSDERGNAYSTGAWVNSSSASVWPYRGTGMQRVRENLDGSTPLFPVSVIPTHGELEGIFAVSGYGNVEPEDLIWQPSTGKKLVVGTNTYRNSTEDFMAMELV